MNASPVYILLFLLVAYFNAFSQSAQSNYFNQHYLFQERLARGLVFDILQDKRAFLWFATEYGLLRYDGKELKTYQHEPGNPFSLAGNVTTCLAEDAEGNLWIGTMNSGLHYFDRNKNQFLRYQYDANNRQSIGNNKVNDVLVRKDGSVWVATEGSGVQQFDKATRAFKSMPKPGSESRYTNALLEDELGQLWLGDFFGLNQWNPSGASFSLVANIQEIDHKGAVLKALAKDSKGNIWAGFRDGGLFCYQADNDQFKAIPEWPENEGDSHVWEIFVDAKENPWVGTDSSLFYLEKTGSSPAFALSRYTLTQERRYLSLYKSDDGVMWIGTNDGIVVLAPRQKPFQLMTPLKIGEVPAETKRGVTAMTDGDGNQFWMGTVRGLFQCDIDGPRLHRDYLTQHPLLARFERDNVSAIYQDKKGKLWLGIIDGFNKGFRLFCYDLTEKILLDFTNRHLLFSSFVTFSIAEDKVGHLWFGNGNGLFKYLPERDSLYQFQPSESNGLSGDKINQVLPTGRGEVWIGTNGAGLVRYDLEEGSFMNFPAFEETSPNPLNPRIISMRENSQSQLWLGTAGGLVLFDHKNQTYQQFDSRNGLANNVIKSFCTDQQGRLWVGSQTNIASFDPENFSFINYNSTDGVEMDEFWDRSCYCDPTGRLYFGGDDGLLLFQPDSIQPNAYIPPIVFTKFLLSNQEVSPDAASKLLPAPIDFAPTITLQPDQNVFTIHFAALSYINPKKTQYAIKMEGFEQDWQMIGNRTEATYTNLNPGTYFFRVKAANNDGRWNEEGATLKFMVLPPWYSTWWAYLGYLTVLASGIYFFYRFQLNRRLAEIESQRLRELDEVKTRLYTNITHEFRTPLTLIQGPVDRALEEPSFALGKQELERIRRNCSRLLKLIHQMLNLNKLEVGALQPDYRYSDVIPALKYIVDAFHSFAESQEVELDLQIEETTLLMDFDQEKLFDIVSNLLSNAIKFTPVGGKVLVQIATLKEKSKGVLEVAVRDTGPGISPKALDKIFDRFYQAPQPALEGREESVRSGSGIGLALSMRLAELMEGTIKVTSELGKGSRFSLQLPIKHSQKGGLEQQPYSTVYVPSGNQDNEALGVQTTTESQEDPVVLIVEDNADVAGFISECLPHHFIKIMAVNGKEGIALAQKHIPDLIVSDVLMPEEDGFSLTEKLKQDPLTSHIPIILLTAKADVDARIEGLGKGADAYMAKPFNRQELLIRVENLLESRRRLQAYYLQQSGLLMPEEEKEQASQQEHTFLKKARRLIEKNIEEQSYTIEGLASDVYMSPTQLYRKIKALTGQSPSKFFRHIQISRAKALLGNMELNITDVAFKTGFNDPAYFTRVFTAETGVPPSSYRENLF